MWLLSSEKNKVRLVIGKMMRHLISFIGLFFLAVVTCSLQAAPVIPSSDRSNNVVDLYSAILKKQFQRQGFTWGSPVFIRIFKVPSILEVWIKKGTRFELFRTYSICKFSGKLGPKMKSGDHQSPEGFYNVLPGQLNPNSSYFLSFNLGYPNAYDKFHNRTGSALMVHGDCASVGCYAMTNARISEIYTLMHAAFENNQPMIQVQALPFALTDNNMIKLKNHAWYGFWSNLKKGYDFFEKNRFPPTVSVVDGEYRFSILRASGRVTNN